MGLPPPSSSLLHMAVCAPRQTTVCMPAWIPHGPPAANFGRCRYLKICIYIYIYLNIFRLYSKAIYHLNHTDTNTFKKNHPRLRKPHIYTWRKTTINWTYQPKLFEAAEEQVAGKCPVLSFNKSHWLCFLLELSFCAKQASLLPILCKE